MTLTLEKNSKRFLHAHTFLANTDAKPSRRWFRLKFADGAIDGTDWDNAHKAQDVIDWYRARFPGLKWDDAEVIELTAEEKRRSLLDTITRTIGPRNADAFLGGK